MEEQNNTIFGIYIMGIKKRPELANKPCIIQYLENERKLVMTITIDQTAEKIVFERDKIITSKNIKRTIVSQSQFKDSSISEYNISLLLQALGGTAGAIAAPLINKSGLFKSSNSGAVNYSSLNEIHITYINDDNEQRDLIIQTDLEPDNIINLINKQ